MKQLIYSSSGDVTGITNGRYSLVECAHSEADPVIARHHYSHKTTKSRFLSLSVNSGLGYVQLGYGIRPRLKRNISTLITADNYCEFDRMWLSDVLPKFAESQVIALLLSYLKQIHRRIKFVITYADESAGNRGTIYRATNAIELPSVVADFYILPTGERVHPIAIYYRHGTRSLAALRRIYPSLIYLKPLRFRQFRFLYILDRKLRRAFLASQHD